MTNNRTNRTAVLFTAMKSATAGAVAVAVAVALFLALHAGSAAAQSQSTARFDLPAQPLTEALRAVGKLTETNILLNRQEIGDRQAPAIKGTLTVQEALTRLLEGTGLESRFIEEKTVVVGGSRATATSADDSVARPDAMLRLAQSNSASPPTQDKATPESDSAQKLDEIIVTAQKRGEERLQEVPMPISVLRAETLQDRNQLRLQDYYNTIPNLVVTPAIVSSQFLAIRGITTGGFSTPTVGVLIDDVPFTPSDRLLGNVVPDIDPSDLAQVEVLRGPQGTLYGASSMGGLLKFVTIYPSSERLSGRLQAGVNSIENGDGLGFNLRGSVNVPVGETFAIRATGFTREDPGYVDNAARGEDGVNSVSASGGRVSALWRPTDAFSLKLSALYQRIEGDGADIVDGPFGVLQQNSKANTGWYDRKTQAYSAVMSARIRSAELISISGYNVNSDYDSLDVPGAPLSVISDQRGEKFTQELRLSGPLAARLEGLVGAFYTHEKSAPFIQTGYVTDEVTGALGAQVFRGVVPFTITEYALFAGLTYRVSDRFDIQLGGRESHFDQTQTDLVVAGGATTTAEFDSKADVFTYLVTPRFKLSPDLMVYARLASGYRANGANVGPIRLRGLPGEFAPDRTKNYELGIKGDFLGRTLTLDASLYYIDWTSIQLQLLSLGAPDTTYIVNGGGAKSQGIELSAEARPANGLRISGWVTLGEAELTEDFPAGSTAFGLAGDRLPSSSRVSGNFSVNQEFPVGTAMTAVAGASVSYVGSRVGVFGPTAARQDFPAYTQVDLHASLQFSSWKASAYVNNAADKRGMIGGGLNSFPGYFYIRPRTIGLSLTKLF